MADFIAFFKRIIYLFTSRTRGTKVLHSCDHQTNLSCISQSFSKHAFIHSPTHPPTHPPTHSLTHSLIYYFHFFFEIVNWNPLLRIFSLKNGLFFGLYLYFNCFVFVLLVFRLGFCFVLFCFVLFCFLLNNFVKWDPLLRIFWPKITMCKDFPVK